MVCACVRARARACVCVCVRQKKRVLTACELLYGLFDDKLMSHCSNMFSLGQSDLGHIVCNIGYQRTYAEKRVEDQKL